MTEPKRARNSVELIEDEARVESLMIQGYTAKEIAARTGLTIDQVYRDKASVEAQWDAVRQSKRDRILGRIVSNQLHVQKAAWTGWVRSQQDAIQTMNDTTTQESPGSEARASGTYVTTKDRTVTKTNAGDAAFLNTIINSDKLLATLLDLEEQKAAAGLSPEFSQHLKSVLGISAEHFEVLRSFKKQREIANARRANAD